VESMEYRNGGTLGDSLTRYRTLGIPTPPKVPPISVVPADCDSRFVLHFEA